MVRKSRLLFAKDEDFLQLLDCSDKTLKRNKEDSNYNERLLDILDRRCLELTECSLVDVYNSYLEASCVYNDKENWGNYWKPTSKKQFCLGLFCKAYLPNSEKQRGIKDVEAKEDRNVTSKFITEDLCVNVDLCYLLLLSYGVINPLGEKIDLTDRAHMLKMKELLDKLDEDFPVAGIFKSNALIKDSCLRIDEMLANNENMSVAEYWCMLSDIASSLKISSSPAAHAECHTVPVQYIMPGIWIDDSDDGETRFWIFPENRMMAFCYKQKSKNKVEYNLEVYEFAFYQDEYEECDIVDRCMICTEKGNKEILFYPGKASAEEKVVADCDFEFTQEGDKDYEECLFRKITFTSVNGIYPDWMKWRSFERLDTKKSDEYANVISDLYYRGQYDDRMIQANAKWLIDTENALIAMDEQYIYLSDRVTPLAHKLEDRGNGHYVYVVRNDKVANARNLLDVEISETTPLFVMPRILDEAACWLLRKVIKTNSDISAKEALQKLKEALEQTKLGDQISIYDCKEKNLPIVLCFNRFSFVLPLEWLINAGIMKKYTSREGLFSLKSENKK